MEHQAGMSMGFTIVWLVVLFGIMYFLMIRPQKKEQKRVQAMLSDMAVGDSIVTTSGFYGVIIDMTEEDVIVEFGNNKNCRIPMRKQQLPKLRKQSRLLHNQIHPNMTETKNRLHSIKGWAFFFRECFLRMGKKAVF